MTKRVDLEDMFGQMVVFIKETLQKMSSNFYSILDMEKENSFT